MSAAPEEDLGALSTKRSVRQRPASLGAHQNRIEYSEVGPDLMLNAHRTIFQISKCSLRLSRSFLWASVFFVSLVSLASLASFDARGDDGGGLGSSAAR
ncbi:hypothetical protein [Sorangium sp. So ce394]|uniref:hypothetical protein n=1 Tax=Sorangium sp. So ce394 TaxID=3133310 RepID=UPI003F5CA4BC